MTVRIAVLGGGSVHWTPRLIGDFANTPSLHDAQVVLHDIDMTSVATMVRYGAQVAAQRRIGLDVSGESDRRLALRSCDFVVSAFSVGGFESMRHDLEIPLKYGIRQPIGDSIGPGGLMRALRSIPVMRQFAADAQAECPKAFFLNVSNPLSALTRVLANETDLRVVGLCNEMVGCMFVLSLLTDTPMHEIDPVVGGINHFPMITELRMGDRDGFAMLHELLDDLDGPGSRGAEPVWMTPPDAMHWTKMSDGDTWTKADVVHNCPVKFEIFRRFGVLPGAHDHHVAEFMPGFVHADNDHGAGWRVGHYGLSGHVDDAATDASDFTERLAAMEVSRMPSGELVASVIDAVVTNAGRPIPVNLSNQGQLCGVADNVIVECIGIVDADGVRPRHEVKVPGIMGEYVRRSIVAQELTVAAAMSGDRAVVLEAMLADPMAGRLPYENVVAMTDEMLDALARWLPQFATR